MLILCEYYSNIAWILCQYCGHTIVIFVHKCFMKDFMSVPLKRKSSKNQTEQSECLFVFLFDQIGLWAAYTDKNV